MVDTTFTHAILATNNARLFPEPDGGVFWDMADAEDVQLNTGDVVTDPSEMRGLDTSTGTFTYQGVTAVYTGYQAFLAGGNYAVFHDAVNDRFFIPYNKADADIAPEAIMDFFNASIYEVQGALVTNCFATGTTILTPDGERAIETLQPGDRVMTHDGRSTPAIWVARQTVANPRGVELGRKPVRIDAGALGPDLPNRPLTVTADHALLFGDMLVNAGTLAEDGTPIRFVPLAEMPTRFVWWHVELENHEVVLANGGVPAESFIDYVSRSGFDNYDEYLDLAGADRLIKEMPFARISARRLLPPNGLRGLPAIARRPLIAAPRKTAA